MQCGGNTSCIENTQLASQVKPTIDPNNDFIGTFSLDQFIAFASNFSQHQVTPLHGHFGQHIGTTNMLAPRIVSHVPQHRDCKVLAE